MIKSMRKMSLSTLVLVCFALGIVTGLFFGESVAWMGVIGDAFIKLLQMTIIPYIVVSLMTSLGKMSYAQARSLGVPSSPSSSRPLSSAQPCWNDRNRSTWSTSTFHPIPSFLSPTATFQRSSSFVSPSASHSSASRRRRR